MFHLATWPVGTAVGFLINDRSRVTVTRRPPVPPLGAFMYTPDAGPDSPQEMALGPARDPIYFQRVEYGSEVEYGMYAHFA